MSVVLTHTRKDSVKRRLRISRYFCCLDECHGGKGQGVGGWGGRCGGVREGDRAAPIDPRKKARRSIFTRSLLLNDSCPGVYVYFYSEAPHSCESAGVDEWRIWVGKDSWKKSTVENQELERLQLQLVPLGLEFPNFFYLL
ncbi:hypothetical protein CDAR_508491 [Caerostris darwini]|uniref:Uncharacterized protein n=1 Tax=Caerostris darwini TaxID=1538125 RepID=A0AAV4N021_9ARAC|nr:hypothetical protein CDAR_508491 [Caerostris darwini]